MERFLIFVTLVVLAISVLFVLGAFGSSEKPSRWDSGSSTRGSSEPVHRHWRSFDEEKVREALVAEGWLNRSGYLTGDAPGKIFAGSSAVVRELVTSPSVNRAARSQKLKNVTYEFSAYLVSRMTEWTLLDLVSYAVRGGSGDVVVIAIQRKVLNTNLYVSNPDVLKVDLGLTDDEYRSLPVTFIEWAGELQRRRESETKERLRAQQEAQEQSVRLKAPMRELLAVHEEQEKKKKAQEAQEAKERAAKEKALAEREARQRAAKEKALAEREARQQAAWEEARARALRAKARERAAKAKARAKEEAKERVEKARLEALRRDLNKWKEAHPAPPPQPYGISPRGAEYWVRDWLTHMGASNAEVTQEGGDGGVDVLGVGIIVQVKLYSSPVSVADVREFAGVASATFPSDQALFFASGGYTSGAVQFAGQARIALFDFDPVEGTVQASNALAEPIMIGSLLKS